MARSGCQLAVLWQQTHPAPVTASARHVCGSLKLVLKSLMRFSCLQAVGRARPVRQAARPRPHGSLCGQRQVGRVGAGSKGAGKARRCAAWLYHPTVGPLGSQLCAATATDQPLQCWLLRAHTTACHTVPCARLPAEGFSSTIIAFTERLGYWEIHAAIRSFTKRLYKSRSSQQGQLGGLTDIYGLRGPRARLLFDRGIKTVEQVAAMKLDR